ncbi:DNA/RNA non-specific endonuclease [Streptomyces sp. NPDC059985]|uniref:DNA/RNA non-specific endonuclease n=1 Tax=Streptomyces sp. NPDC059985 TaxID=3347025 RepID=UPI0036CA4916
MHRIRPRVAAGRRARSAVLAVLAAVTVGLATTGTAVAQPTSAAFGRTAGLDRADTALPPTTLDDLPKKSAEHCEATKVGSKERRRGAVEACVSFSRSPARSAAAPRPSVPQGLAADAGCSVNGAGNYSYERFSYCVRGLNVFYTLRDGNGVEIGWGTLEVATSASLPASGTTWNEQVTVRMTEARGDVTTLSVKFRAACGAGCTATKYAPWYGADLTNGQFRTGPVTYSSTPAAGAVAEFSTSYQMYVTMPGATITDPSASWTNPRRIRCDDAVGDVGAAPSPGCVVPSEMAVVPMKAQSSDAGGAVAAYQWAQQSLNDGWGKTKPLTRQKTGTADRESRTCGTFNARDDLVENDTCGQFPFAEAKEGGSAGARCVELIPNASSGGWDTYVLGNSLELDPAAPCVRAHLSPADRQFADRKLAEGFQAQRVIDADQFRVDISTPTQAAQAACLQIPPAGSVPSGNGWRKNTTKTVDHVNKTTNPPGPAGTRPSLAQACLGKKPGKGKAASGSPTGWLDAQKFRDDFAPGTGQARCHLIANILGGPGQTEDGGQDNLVPCWQVGMNTGTPSMRTFEREAQEKVKEAGFGEDDAIFYQVNPVFRDDTSTIPLGMTMSATIERANGTREELFPNVFVPNTLTDTGTLNLGN